MPPKRPDPAAALGRGTGRGAEAIYGGNGSTPATAGDASSLSFEARHKRVTFHCPLELLDELEEELARSGRKKNAVIVEALRSHLAGARPARKR